MKPADTSRPKKHPSRARLRIGILPMVAHPEAPDSPCAEGPRC